MRFQVLGAFGGDTPECRMTSFLVDDVLAVDAGATCRALPVERQRLIRHLLVSHSHIDHTASLPFLVENIFGIHDHPLSIYASASTLAKIRNHVFNDDTWPDFTRIPNSPTSGLPTVRFVEITDGVPFTISDEGLEVEVTPVPVNHVIPTCGFLIRGDGDSLLYSADTGPTDELWRVANGTDDLGMLVVECSFPNRLQALADLSLHLTPESLSRELEKLQRTTEVRLFHLKPPHVEELRRDLADTGMPCPVQELEQDRTYTL